VTSQTEDEVFAAVKELADRGEYLDDIPGAPTGELNASGAWFRPADGDALRRIYRRGSPDHLHARAAGLVERLPALVPASAAAVREAETIIGHTLPPLLVRLYTEIGNGGFGPAYGILGLAGGHGDGRKTAIDLYRESHTPLSPWSFLPASTLPLCHWGCAIYSFIDCTQPEGPIRGWDPNPGPVGPEAFFRQPFVLADWLDRWVRGRLFQPALVLDPTTQQWRGATDEEYEQWMSEMDEPPD
jgi:hypothetical protein